MKNLTTKIISILVAVALVAGSLPTANAADVTKADNPDALNLGTSWVGGVVPVAGDTIVLSTFTANRTSLLGATTSLEGIVFGSTGYNMTFSATAGATLTLGSGGINGDGALTASSNLTFNCATVLGASQTWSTKVTSVSITTVFTRTVQVGGNFDLAGNTLTLDGQNAWTTTGAVVRPPAGSFQFSATATISDSSAGKTGGILLKAGVLTINNGATLGGVKITMEGSGDSLTTGYATITLSGGYNHTSDIVLKSNYAFNRIGSGGNNTVSGTISGSGGVTFFNTGSVVGIITVTGDNKHTGGTWILGNSSGMADPASITAGHDNAFGTGPLYMTGTAYLSTVVGGGDRTFANLLFGGNSTGNNTFIRGTNNITFTGGYAFNSAAGSGFVNNIADGKSLTFRDATDEDGNVITPGSGNILLGFSGDGTNRSLTIAGSGMTIIKSNIVNATGNMRSNGVTLGAMITTGTTTANNLTYIGGSTSKIIFEGKNNTYTGSTTLTASSASKLTIDIDNSTATGLISVGSTCMLTGKGTVNAVTISAGVAGVDDVSVAVGRGLAGGTLSGNLIIRGALTLSTLADGLGANVEFSGASPITMVNNAVMTINAPITSGTNRESWITFKFTGDNWYYDVANSVMLFDLVSAGTMAAASITNLQSVVIDQTYFQGTVNAISLYYNDGASSTTYGTSKGIWLVGATNAIPEPSTYALLVCGFALLALRRRSRK